MRLKKGLLGEEHVHTNLVDICSADASAATLSHSLAVVEKPSFKRLFEAELLRRMCHILGVERYIYYPTDISYVGTLQPVSLTYSEYSWY